MNFKEAFAAARKAGKKEFTWNGKSYHTKTKEEMGGAGASRPKTRTNSNRATTPLSSPRPVTRSGGTKPAVSPGRGNGQSETARRNADSAKPAVAKAAPAKNKPKGGISDQERANKGKPTPKTKSPSVSEVARAIDFQGSGYTDVMKGGPRVPPAKKATKPRRKGGWGDQ